MPADGYTLLGAVAGAPDVFPDIGAAAAKAARDLVVKQLKTRTLPLSGLRRVHDCIGEPALKQVVGGMKPAEIKSLVTRLDREDAALKTAGADEHTRRLLALAAGAEPAARAPRPARGRAAGATTARTPAPKTPKAGRALGSPAFSAVWDGKDHDAPPARGKRR